MVESNKQDIAGALFGLKQGGTIYEQASGTLNFSNEDWEGISESGLVASDFQDASDGSSMPDFSATGTPITFGYIRFNGNGSGSSQKSVTSGIDNFQWTITAVPEPSSLALLAVGGMLLSRRPRSAHRPR